MKGIQLVRNRILYPGLVRGNNQPYKVQSKPVDKDMTKKELTQAIRELFSNGQTLYYSDIAEQLDTDLKSVVDVCRELQENEEIGVDTSALARAH
jgi:DNA invertase Pin-like site-specific DNA recombinase